MKVKMKVSAFFLILALLAPGLSACTQVPPLPGPDSYTGLADANALGQELLLALEGQDNRLASYTPVYVISLMSPDHVEGAYYLYHLYDTEKKTNRSGWMIADVEKKEIALSSYSDKSHYETIKEELFPQYDIAEIRYIFDGFIIFPIVKLTGDYYFRYYWNDRELKEMEYKFSTISEARELSLLLDKHGYAGNMETGND